MNFIKQANMSLSSSLIFHSATDLAELDDIRFFGKLEIQVEDCDIPEHTWDIKFSIDCSGSMSETCNDGNTKMQHIQHTMINILRLFVDYTTVKFNVSIDMFDDKYELLLDFTHITNENLNEMINKINNIYPRNSTNLILPLEKTKNEIKNRKIQFPQHKQLHILLTDGCDTCNSNVYKQLKPLCSDMGHAFIAFGFGVNHDAKALTIMCDNSNSQYGFIDELEKAGLVYGEYLHTVLYKVLHDITITIENGEIYNWKNNTWSSTLYINHLDSGALKTYYVRTNDICGCIYGDITGFENITISEYIVSEFNDEFTPVPDLMDMDNDTIIPVDLTPHVYRYRTLKLMAEVKESYEQVDFDYVKMKKNIKDFYEEIKNYIDTNNLTDDIFMKKIKDDVYILYKTLGTEYYELYSGARQRSQGNQNICSATQINTIDTVPYMVKCSRMKLEDFADSDADTDIENDDVLDNTAYEMSCPRSVSKMMRTISEK
jgi:Ser-tRNA(Ala) deacylase AlaX